MLKELNLIEENSCNFVEEHKDNAEDINACANCKAYDIKLDYASGTMVCTSCGLVNEDRIIDESAEWSYGPDDSSGKDPSRCGAPVNHLLEKSSLSTMISKSWMDKKHHLLQRLHQQNSMDYVERSRYHVFEKIQRMTNNYNLPDIITEQAKAYYKTLSEKKLSRGSIRNGLIACCIMYACELHNVPRSTKEISEMCDVDTSVINNASKIFCEYITVESKDNSLSSNLVKRYCSQIGIPKEDEYKIIREVTKLSIDIDKTGIMVGKTPGAVTSAIIFYVCEKNKMNVQKKIISKAHNVSVVTLNKLIGIIKTNYDT